MGNTDRDMRINYTKFIEIIGKDIPGLNKSIRDANVKIRLLDRIENVLDEIGKESNYEKDVEKLIYYANTIINSIERISTDEYERSSIKKKVAILEQFKKIDNLDNKVAINTYNGIIKSLNDMLSKREEIEKEKDILVNKLKDIENLKQLIPIELEKIKALGETHSIEKEKIVEIVLFLIKENARIPAPIKKEKPKQKEKPEVVVETIAPKMTEEEIEKANKALEELKQQEEEINKEYSELIEKYYNKLEKMSNIKRTTCYSNLDKERMEFVRDNINAYSDEDLGDMWRCILAINILRLKNQVSQNYKELHNKVKEGRDSYEDINDYISIAISDLEKYKEQIEDLYRLDKNINSMNKPIVIEDKQQVFFAHGIEDFIDEDIKADDKLRKRLITRINNVIANGDKKGNNTVVRVKGLDEYDFPTIFAFNDGNEVNIAFIQLPKAEDGLHRIFVLAAQRQTDDLLKATCRRLLNKNLKLFITEIKKIEEEDVQELGIQKEIYDSIFSEQKNSEKIR